MIILQISKPMLADKLSIRAQIRDLSKAKQLIEFLKQSNAFVGTKAALLPQNHLQQRPGDTPMDDSKGKNIHRRRA